ncbi:MAG: SDR family oxidoreductase [Alphaproteobacteria bacterium]|nr:SDR family oxidoreductase [Alphaproteobacteria bacterium]
MRLKNKIAVVTGGGGGIGLGIAQRLADEGASIAIADINADNAKAAADLLRAKGITAIGAAMDVSDEASVGRFFDLVTQQLGLATILVHAAAIWSNVTVQHMSCDEWDHIQAVNTRGTFLVCKRAMQDMMSAKEGRIVNIASTIFLSGGPGFSHYAASKGAVIAFSRSLAGEAGQYGITVNCVAPGLIATEAALTTHGHQGVEAIVQQAQIIKRAGQPDDIAAAVAFFVGPDAGFTTGQTLYVNGGMYFG